MDVFRKVIRKNVSPSDLLFIKESIKLKRIIQIILIADNVPQSVFQVIEQADSLSFYLLNPALISEFTRAETSFLLVGEQVIKWNNEVLQDFASIELYRQLWEKFIILSNRIDSNPPKCFDYIRIPSVVNAGEPFLISYRFSRLIKHNVKKFILKYNTDQTVELNRNDEDFKVAITESSDLALEIHFKDEIVTQYYFIQVRQKPIFLLEIARTDSSQICTTNFGPFVIIEAGTILTLTWHTRNVSNFKVENQCIIDKVKATEPNSELHLFPKQSTVIHFKVEGLNSFDVLYVDVPIITIKPSYQSLKSSDGVTFGSKKISIKDTDDYKRIIGEYKDLRLITDDPISIVSKRKKTTLKSIVNSFFTF